MKVFALRLCLMLLTFSEWHVQSQTNTTNSVLHKRRSLQFDGMFIGDNYEFYNQNPRGKAKKGQRAINPARQRASNLRRAVADILAGAIFVHTFLHIDEYQCTHSLASPYTRPWY